jgi:hypothetical protein
MMELESRFTRPVAPHYEANDFENLGGSMPMRPNYENFRRTLLEVDNNNV